MALANALMAKFPDLDVMNFNILGMKPCSNYMDDISFLTFKIDD